MLGNNFHSAEQYRVENITHIITNRSRKVSLVIGDNSSGSDSPYKPGNQYEPTDPRSPEAQNSLQYLIWEENDEGGITIKKCAESAIRITIPREINGKPVTDIGNAFNSCYKLTCITIPESVTIIRDGAFVGCENLTDINIPDSVTMIGYAAFNKCTSLTNITIPESVTSIGEFAFTDCGAPHL